MTVSFANSKAVYQSVKAADACDRGKRSVIVAQVEAVSPDHFGMASKLPEDAFPFERHIRQQKLLSRTPGVQDGETARPSSNMRR